MNEMNPPMRQLLFGAGNPKCQPMLAESKSGSRHYFQEAQPGTLRLRTGEGSPHSPHDLGLGRAMARVRPLSHQCLGTLKVISITCDAPAMPTAYETQAASPFAL